MNRTANNKNLKKKSSAKFIYLALILGVALGYLLGYLTISTQKKPKTQDSQNFSETRSGGYLFTNPLLDCDNFHPSLLKAHVKLKNDLDEYVDNAIKNGYANHISVYFRSLNNGPWIGINEHYNYSPASLLKVPLLIATLKKAETDTMLLKKEIFYDKAVDTIHSPNIVDKVSIKVGNTYTVDELLKYMIAHSDNNAKEILFGLIGDEYLMKVLSDLGINLKNRDLTIDFLSVKEYSSFFRILYNASYLDRDMSEKALELLSRVQFNKGIPFKLPKNITISHKFGERGFMGSNIKQLHDCGIVYVPNSPYLICIMTKGDDFDQLTKIISEVSEIVYNCVAEQ